MKILKEVGVLLIITSMILSTVVVTANTYNLRQDAKSIEKATERFSDFDRNIETGVTRQNQIFYEDFDTGVWPSEGFPIIDSDFGNPETWVLGDTEYHTSPYSAEVWWAEPPPDQSEWLISEEITIDGFVELEFYSFGYLGSPEGDEFKVKISPTGSSNHEDFITIWDATNDYPTNTGWHEFTDPPFTIDLSAYCPGTVRIAFHADGTTSIDGGLWYIWFIDTVSINYREPIPDLDCEGELSWEDIAPGDTVDGSFTVMNIGEPDSLLDWEVKEWPDWGNWSFDPESGTGLPEGDSITVDVEVIAPDEENTEFTGEIVLVNSDDPDDICIIEVTLVTPYLDIGRVWLRGWLFRCNRTGNINTGTALRLHYIEFMPTERTIGLVTLNNVSFKDSVYLRGRMYNIGLFTYVLGFFEGGLEILDNESRAESLQ